MKKQKTQRQAVRKKTTIAERKSISSNAAKAAKIQRHKDQHIEDTHLRVIKELMRSKMTDEDKGIFDRQEVERRLGVYKPDEDLEERYDEIFYRSRSLVTDQEIQEKLAEARETLGAEQSKESLVPNVGPTASPSQES